MNIKPILRAAVFSALLSVLFALSPGASEDESGFYLDFTDPGGAAYSYIYDMCDCEAYYDADEGALIFSALSPDPHFSVLLPDGVDLSKYPYFAIRLKNPTGVSVFEMYLATDGGKIVDESGNFKADISAYDSDYADYIWNGAEAKPALWRGVLTTWRFDCLNNSAAEDVCYIKGMGFFSSAAAAESCFSAETASEPTEEITSAQSETVKAETEPYDATGTPTETDADSGISVFACLAGASGALCAVFIVCAIVFRRNKRAAAVLFSAALLFIGLTIIFTVFAVSETSGGAEETTEKPAENNEMKYTGPFVTVNGTLAGVDSLGRVLPEACDAAVPGGKVGVFYFLWLGADNSEELDDVSEIIKNDPTAYETEEKWAAAGGGGYFATHFWGKPLFGYYTMNDEWVIRKHAQMLSAAGVDYIIFDTTNSRDYIAQALKVLKVFNEFYQEGISVPQVAFYTNTNSGERITSIYEKLYERYDAEYSHLWFNWDGKPLIIGRRGDKAISDGARDFFTIKEAIWPNEERRKESDNAFPWMEFSRLYTKDAVYGKDGRREVVSVSAAQHCDTLYFSETAFYNGNDHTRNWHNGANDSSVDAVLYGYNFAEQWEWAIEQAPETIFVTGFNEWAAQRMNNSDVDSTHLIQFYDCADLNNSRDIEPMSGGFADNYFMQLCRYTRLYKGSSGRVDVGANITIDINGSFSQFDAATAVYTDAACDTPDRYARGFAGLLYEDDSGRNNIDEIKVVRDAEYIYFYVKTVGLLTDPSDEGWMTLFLSSGTGAAWEGYDLIVNRTSPEGGSTAVERCSKDGEWAWEKVADAEINYSGNELMLKLPRFVMGSDSLVDIRFKFADNYTPGDVISFYTSGDCAPYGRFNYVFSDKK